MKNQDDSKKLEKYSKYSSYPYGIVWARHEQNIRTKSNPWYSLVEDYRKIFKAGTFSKNDLKAEFKKIKEKYPNSEVLAEVVYGTSRKGGRGTWSDYELIDCANEDAVKNWHPLV
jgi:hypothetical protein